ncbi:ABC transporter substrate-binding protein [Kribbella sp. NBC_00482]|uniref:ABC transporter substrate-binding protein n=1 Tax=Kribbella sp. NBC_00482 TaxID=2975968 RepID=UPI002E1907A3
MRGSNAAKAAVAALAVAMLSTGCLSGAPSDASSGNASGPGKSTVEVMYGFGDSQEAAFQKDLNTFAQANGFTIKFSKAGSWDTEIRARVAGGSAPDVGLFPQPGLMCDLAAKKTVLAYDDATVQTDTKTLVPGFVGAGTCPDGKVYGLPAAVSVKSLLWYDKPAFAAAGYTVPTTLDELTALTDKIRSQGKTPWCIAAESGQATGWPVTDWIEDLVLRLAGPDNYDKWVKGQLKFSSPEIKPAFDYFQKIALTDGNVLGGSKAIVATNFQTGGNALFKQPPGCYLFKQATFVAGKGGFPDAVLAKLDTEVGVAAFPVKEAGNNPVLTGGDLAAAFNNDANTIKLRNFIASKDNGIEVGKAGYFSPHNSFDVSLYPNNTLRTIARDVLYKSTAARFDGSDLMPAKVGAGTFWTEPVAWISGKENLDEALKNIDASWPKAS